MGFFDKKPEQDIATVIVDKKTVIPKDTETNLKFTQELIKALGTNNTELILQAVDIYNEKFDANNARRIRMEPYATNIKNFHTRLVNSIDGSRSLDGLNSEERISALGNMSELKDATRTFNTMKRYISKEVNVLKDSVVTDGVVAGNREIKTTIEKIFERFSDLKTRNMFFEYKYIQMYLFMSVFVQHVYNTMDKFIVDVISINELKDRYRQEAYKQIFDKLLQMFEIHGDSLNLTVENTDEFFNTLAKGMDKKMDDVKKSYDAAAKASMDDILRFILENENSMTKSLLQLVKDKNANAGYDKGNSSSDFLANSSPITPPSSVNPQNSVIETPYTPLVKPQPPNSAAVNKPPQGLATVSLEDIAERLRDMPSAPPSPPKTGGFIKSGTMFPKEFYDASGSQHKPQSFSSL